MLSHVGTRISPGLLEFLATGFISHRKSSSLANSRKLNSHSQSEPSFGYFPLDSRDPSALLHKLRRRVSLLTGTERPPAPDSDAGLFNETVSNLRTALKKNDVRTVCRHWSQLSQKNLLRLMGPPQLESCSRLMAASCLVADQQESWLGGFESQQVMDEIAIVTAAGGATEALNAVLMTHIKRNAPTSVFELYRRYLELLDGKEGWDQVDGGEGGHLLASNSVVGKTPSVVGGTRILLAVITAHAIRDSFEGALQTFLQSPQQFNTRTVKDFLKNLQEFPQLQQRVENYSRLLITARKVSRPSALAKGITNLSENPFHLERLYDSVIDGLTGPNAYLAAIPAAVCTKRPLLMPEVGWMSFLSAFVKCRRLDLARKLWDDMIRLGVTPTVSIWAALFNGYDSIRAVNETLIGWKSMISHGIKPDTSVYRALISTLFNGNRPEDALGSFESFKNERSRRAATPEAFTEGDALIVYNTVLQGLLRYSRHIDAATLISDMKSYGPSPDLVTFNTLLRHHGKKGDMQGIANTLKAMGEASLVPDVFTYSTILTTLLKMGREDAPEMVISQMRKQGIEPNVQTYTAIIDQQVREGDERSIVAALRMLSRMEQDPETRPNQVTYTSVLAAIHRGRWSDRLAAEDCRRYVVEQMKARGMLFDRTTYNVVLVACLQNTEPEGLQYALKYYAEMVQRTMPISNETWYVILQGLTAREEWAIADEMVAEMINRDVEPRGALGRLVQLVRDRTRKKRMLGPGAYF